MRKSLFPIRLLAAIGISGFSLLILKILVPQFLDGLFPDDAFYHLRIARNLADGLGPPFDGINRTNGYHPLWMARLEDFFQAVPAGKK